MGEKYCDYNWGKLKNSEGDEVTCMCQICFNSMDRMGKSNGNAHHEFSNIRNKSKEDGQV